jgi:hypothetical protein
VARIAVVNSDAARLTLLDGSSLRAATEDLLTFGWLAGSHRLVAILGQQSAPAQIAAWQPDDPRLRVAPLTLPPGTWPIVGDAY